MFNIRKIAPEDSQKFNRLMKCIESESYNMLYDPEERQTTDSEQASFIDRIMKNSRSGVMVAEMNDELIGFIVVMGEGLKKRAHSRYIAMGVLSKYHGLKIGSALMASAIQFCEQQAVSRIELTVIKTNISAIKLYLKFGFEIEGLKRNSLSIQGKAEDEYYMSKLF